MAKISKILCISGHYPPCHGGGYGLHMSWFCDGLRRRGYSVRVLTSRLTQPDVRLVEEQHIIRTLFQVDYSRTPFGLLFRTRANQNEIRRVIAQMNPDVILCGSMDGIGFNSYISAISSNRPSLSWLGDTWLSQAWRNLRQYDRWHAVASFEHHCGLGRVRRRAVRRLGQLLGVQVYNSPPVFGPVAAISQFVLNDLVKSGAPVPPDTPIIPVSLHPAFFDSHGNPIGHSGHRTSALRVLFVGRMEMLKGPDTALRAVAAAVNQGADVTLGFAGLHFHAIHSQLVDLASSLGIADRVLWHGTLEIDELVSLYRNHDVFLFPSRIVEGLGVVNVEALACGLPVIGTAHSGSAEVILPGETGFRVEKDDHHSIARYLTELYSNRELLNNMSTRAPSFVRRFAPERVLNNLESALTQCVCACTT